jgi:hypothetical protein
MKGSGRGLICSTIPEFSWRISADLRAEIWRPNLRIWSVSANHCTTTFDTKAQIEGQYQCGPWGNRVWMWTEMNWLKTGSSCGVSWKWYWGFRFRNIWSISWLYEAISRSKVGLLSMEVGIISQHPDVNVTYEPVMFNFSRACVCKIFLSEVI